MGQTNQLLAGVGAALLLIGQFLPMLCTPVGLSVSFVDLPWKAVGVGAAARAGIPEVVLVIAVLYPLCIFGFVVVAFSHIWGGTRPGTFTVLGEYSLMVTALYGGALLALPTRDEFRLVVVFTSPGFGWAVVSIGALVLLGAGKINHDSRR
jgi:hypothetical protein